MMRRTDRRPRDHGSILPLVLVVVLVLSVVVISLAEYATTTLRFGQAVEQSADRLASANGGLDNALETLDRNASICALTTLANGAGVTFSLGDTLNGIEPSITCRSLGGDVTGIEEYALILTGDPDTGYRDGPIFEIEGSATPPKVINGPVYMGERPLQGSTANIAVAATIEDGDLWYSHATCPATDAAIPPNLLITPQGYGLRCLEQDWATLFAPARPVEPAVAGFTPKSHLAPASTDALGCRIWEPGKYSAAPDLGNGFNYFESGDYYFESVGEWLIANDYVLAGAPGPSGPRIPGKQPSDLLAVNPCRDAWAADAPGGAAFYLGGDSRITIEANGALEITGRAHGNQLVSLQALEVQGTPTTIRGDFCNTSCVRLIELGPGANKQFSIWGLLWAPYASIELRNVSNEAVAALTGGAVMSEIKLGAPASSSNLLVGAGGTPSIRLLEFTSTAANEGTTSARAVVEYRNGDYAQLSRRVICITPESGC